MPAPTPYPASGGAPPGWYADPAGAVRYWDGVAWNDVAAPRQRTGGHRRRPRRRTLVIVLALSVVGVLLMGGCIGLALRSQNSFEADTADLAGRVLQPADLAGSWEVRDPAAPPPVGPPIPRSTHRVGHVCPAGQEGLTRVLVDSGELVGRGSAAVAESALVRPATGIEGGAGFVEEGVVAYWVRSDADAAFAAYGRARDCTETWAYTAPDDSRWQVRNEPIDSRPFGPNMVVSRTTYTAVDADGPGGEPAPSDPPTTYVNVVSRDGDRLLLLSTTGLSVEETATVFDAALENLVR